MRQAIVGLAFVVFIAPAATGKAQLPPKTEVARPQFETASLKRNVSATQGGIQRYLPGGRFTAMRVSLPQLIQFAYSVSEFQLFGLPEVFKNQRFDVEAKAENAAPQAQVRLMLQVLLENRFGLVSHAERREMQHFALQRDRSDGRLGASLVKIAGDVDCSTAQKATAAQRPPRGTVVALTADCGSLDRLASAAMTQVRAFVADRTGLTGDWFYQVFFAPTNAQPPPSAGPIDLNYPIFATAIKEQLGLRLEPTRGPVDVLVIDSIHEATEN